MRLAPLLALLVVGCALMKDNPSEPMRHAVYRARNDADLGVLLDAKRAAGCVLVELLVVDNEYRAVLRCPPTGDQLAAP